MSVSVPASTTIAEALTRYNTSRTSVIDACAPLADLLREMNFGKAEDFKNKPVSKADEQATITLLDTLSSDIEAIGSAGAKLCIRALGVAMVAGSLSL